MPKHKKEEKITKGNSEALSFREELSDVQESSAETKEKKIEFSPEEIEELRRKIEKTELDDKLKMQVQSQAQSIKTLDEEKKIKKLLELAKSKGIVFAVNVAKKMDDPYVLDTLHDFLAKEGYYKKFT